MVHSGYREPSDIPTSKSNEIPSFSQATQLSTWSNRLRAKEGVELTQALGTPLRHAHPCYHNQHTMLSDCVLRPYRSPSACSTRISQSRTPQPNYTLTWERYSSRFGQENHDNVYTPAVHAQIAHEFCHGPVTSPPLSEQASTRHDQWHSWKLPVAEGQFLMALPPPPCSCPLRRPD
ncbi:hypothetical protein BKA70DRAFT_1256278 [Coprinopsis sp. MPI-PUGE-AT-0042]|nr:hypothetical protein BKA70DRAFT_1256278 [Coprinopsis sp. MPI-PUGE-AT-0042]